MAVKALDRIAWGYAIPIFLWCFFGLLLARSCTAPRSALLLPDLPPLQAELKKEAKTAKAELKAAKESHKALKGEQAALEAARAEVAALRVQQEARAADIAAAQAGLKVWGSVGGRGGIQAAVRGGRVLGDSEGAWCEDFPTPHHAAMHLFPHIPPPPSPPSMQPAQADHVAKCAAVAKREAAAEKREAALEKREAAAERKEAAVAAAQAQVKEADAGIKADIKKLAAREKAAEEVCCEELAIMIKVWHSTRNLRRHTVLVFSYCFSIYHSCKVCPHSASRPYRSCSRRCSPRRLRGRVRRLSRPASCGSMQPSRRRRRRSSSSWPGALPSMRGTRRPLPGTRRWGRGVV